ncbi:MAG TPA: diaminopimelate dehydrogenase, partial [Clostridia bacterium]|nr:diaminopimelate dehydrogenase [Clostridia bacterium]
VVAEEGADKERIENEIKSMPNYFADYNTIVHFVSQEELKANHSRLPHGGFVIRSGVTGENNLHITQYRITLDSNPEFTACVLAAYARAAVKLADSGAAGAMTVFDIPPALLWPRSRDELFKLL